MPIDPIWKRALKAVVEIKEPPAPPPPEPIPQSAYDELDGALKIQERCEARQTRPAATPQAAGADTSADPVVDADGNVRFEAVYAQARVPAVPFTAEQALDMLGNMPAGVDEKTRHDVINVTLSALGRSVGGTPEAIVADAARKQAALQEFRRTRGDEMVELTGTARARIAELQGEIARSQALIEKAGQQYDALTRSCQAEEGRMDAVVDFFSRTPPPA